MDLECFNQIDIKTISNLIAKTSKTGWIKDDPVVNGSLFQFTMRYLFHFNILKLEDGGLIITLDYLIKVEIHTFTLLI